MSDETNLPLAGIRVLELASWVFVPAAGAILADWGADVVKVEAPNGGDPGRGLVVSLVATNDAPVRNWAFEQHNRSKRSVSVNLRSPEGLELFYHLIKNVDVFLTNYLPPVRKRLGIDVNDLRAHNPKLVYAKGSALGARGAERDRGGYDYSAFWSRGGIGSAYHHPSLEYPLRQTGAFGDTAAAQSLAGGVSAALLKRERTGEPSVVDVSLLSTSTWMMGMDMVSAAAGTGEPSNEIVFGDRTQVPNPINNVYRTADERFIVLVMLEADRFWPDLCTCLGHPELISDERFATAELRARYRRECVAELDGIFAQHDLAHWTARLEPAKGIWAAVQSVTEAARDPQVLANEYLLDVKSADGTAFKLASNPVQFDETPAHAEAAPEFAADTEMYLLEAGYSWEQISELKDKNATL